MKAHRRKLFIALVILVAGGLFLWLVDVPALITSLRDANGPMLLLATIFFMFGAGMVSVRWRYVLRMVPDYRPTFYTDAIGYLANITLHIPAPAGRTVGISRVSPVSLPQATSGIVVERLYEQVMRLLALLLTIVLAVAGRDQTSAIISGVVVLGVAVVLIYLLLRNKDRIIPPVARMLGRLPRLEEEQVRHVLIDMLSGLSESTTPRQLVVGMTLSFVLWGFFYVYQLLTLIALNTGLPLEAMAGVAMLVLAVAPPSAPAMFGIYHAVVIGAVALAWPGHLSTVTAYALVLHIIQLIVWGVFGLYGLTQVDFRLGDIVQGSKALEAD